MDQAGREPRRPRWSAEHPADLRPQDVIRYADLAGVSFAGARLADVTFFGCCLNGASFVGADLAGARFVGCYAGAEGDPVRFGGTWPPVELTGSHVAACDAGPGPLWPPAVAAAAGQALTGDNVRRYRAVGQLGASGYPPVAPFLAGLLADQEWDVRAAVVRALAALRGSGFPDGDEAIVRSLVEMLGDENSIVASQATDFVAAAQPSLDVLAGVVRQVYSDDLGQVVTGLRTVVALCRAADPRAAVSATFDGGSLLHLLTAPEPVVRAEYLHALGAANQNVGPAWEAGLADPDPGVRARGLAAIRLLDDLPPARIVEPLVADPVEAVRIEALFALGHIGAFDRSVVRAAQADPSEQVRRYAVMLLDATQ